MKFTPIHKLLKGNIPVTIREAEPKDAKELCDVVKEYVEESEFIPYTENEFTLTVDEERKWIQTFSDIENSLLLLAIIGGQIVGNLSLNGNNRKMLKHTAVIGVGLLKQFRGNGLGSLLFESSIEWARKQSTLEILSLETYSTNEAGIALYKKFGFIESGVLNDFIKLAPDKYIDSVIMRLKIQ